MNLTLCLSSSLLWYQVMVGWAVAITRQFSLALCPSYAKALCGLITNRGAACLRSEFAMKTKGLEKRKKYAMVWYGMVWYMVCVQHYSRYTSTRRSRVLTEWRIGNTILVDQQFSERTILGESTYGQDERVPVVVFCARFVAQINISGLVNGGEFFRVVSSQPRME